MIAIAQVLDLLVRFCSYSNNLWMGKIDVNPVTFTVCFIFRISQLIEYSFASFIRFIGDLKSHSYYRHGVPFVLEWFMYE
jgi:hypothetical protein